MAILIDTYSESNQSTSQSVRSGLVIIDGQAFTATGLLLASAIFNLSRDGSPTGNCYARIYTHSGTYGTSSVGTGSPLAESDPIDVTTISASPTFTLTTFTFSGANRIYLVKDTPYIIAFNFEGGSSGNDINVGIDAISPTHGGNRTFFNSAWNAVSTSDSCFYIYGEAPGGQSVSLLGIQ